MCLIEINTQIRHKVCAIALAKYYILRKQTNKQRQQNLGRQAWGHACNPMPGRLRQPRLYSDTVSEHE